MARCMNKRFLDVHCSFLLVFALGFTCHDLPSLSDVLPECVAVSADNLAEAHVSYSV